MECLKYNNIIQIKFCISFVIYYNVFRGVFLELPIEIIDDRYRVIKSLGGGGFSEVYLVEGPSGPCALKLLKGDVVLLKKAVLEEFRHEFQILKDMRHPNIAGILDFGFDESNQRYYYTSEYIEGTDFVSATEGKTIEEVTELIVEALRALEYLHSYQIHHFDIKAANVLVVGSAEPTVKIIDFGLAGLDPRGRIVGTPSYMPPEIAQREPADRRADLYSLGVLWYMALARKNPFRATNTEETIARQLTLVPPPPSSTNPTIPPWMDQIILRLLEKNPANRYQSAQAVIRDVNRLGKKHYKLETRETLLSYLPDEGRFIGRAAEIGCLEETAVRIASGDETGVHIALIAGPQGVGKTRLLTELKYRLQLKDIRVRQASAADGAGAGAWCDELEEHLATTGEMLSFVLDDAGRMADDNALAGRIVSLLYAARRPAAGVRLFVVLAARDDECRDALQPLRQAAHDQIALRAFTQQEVTDYLISLTGLSDPPTALLEGIYRRTEGNPLFMTEFIRSLIAGGGLFDEHGRWKQTLFEDVGVDFSKAILSDTVGDLLVGRVASFTEEQRRLLAALSVAGLPSHAADLGAWAVVDDPHAKVFALIQAGVLERLEGFAVQFRNGLMGQVLYDRMADEERRTLHDRIAGALEAAGEPRGRVLEHVSRGADRARALEAALALGERALASGRGHEAEEHFERALALVAAGDVELQVKVQMWLGEASLIAHDYGSAKERFSVVESFVARDAADPKAASWRVEVLVRLGGTYIKLQEPGRARAALGEAKEALSLAGGEVRSELVIDNFLAALLVQEGRPDEARRIFERTREAWMALGRDDRAKVNNNDLGMVLVSQGEFAAAQRILEDDVARAGELGDDLLIGRAHYHLAQLSLAQRDFMAAAEAYHRCVDVCRRSENTELLLRAYNGLGNAFQLAGDLAQSVAFYERGLALHERVGDLRGGAAIAVNIGIVETARGAYEPALDRLIPAVEYLRGVPQKAAVDWFALARGLLELGDVWHRKRREGEARACLEEARDIASRVPRAASLRFWILATLAEVALAEERSGEASELVGMMKPLAGRDDEQHKLEEIAGEVQRRRPVPSMVDVTTEEERAPAPKPRPAQEAQAYRRILEINKLIAVESDLDYVLKTVLYYALELARAEVGMVLLLDERGELAVACERNTTGSEAEERFSRTLARRAIAAGEPVMTDNAMEDARFEAEASVAAHRLQSVLCLPVRSRGRIIGALFLEHRSRAGAFAHADLSLIDAFADQMGLAIETARMLAGRARREEDLKVELSEASRRAEHYQELLEERGREGQFDLGPLIGRSSAMARVLRMVSKIAPTELSVFLCGETGTGKELIARALHANHPQRRAHRFVAINCGAIPATLMESELFGYKAGAFTGAARDKRGLIEEAHEGTLFLDEVSELELSLQVKLLRVLQERECVRVGATEVTPVDLRVVAASNRDIEEQVRQGTFREDLYYRLCQMRIDIPPLRERAEDLIALAAQFLAEAAPGRSLSLHPRLLRRLLSYPWPGNIRELHNVIQVASALAEGDVVDERAIPDNHPLSRMRSSGATQPSTASPLPASSPPSVSAQPQPSQGHEPAGGARTMIDAHNAYDPRKSWKDYERAIVVKCYEVNGHGARSAAAELGISIATLYNRIREWGLDDRANPAYQDPFIYTRGKKLDEYLPAVFAAALVASGSRPSVAIANLRVSQGYFYKVIRRVRHSADRTGGVGT